MKLARKTFVVGAVAAIIVSAISSGCGDDKATTPPSSAASPSAQPSGYSALLIKPSDIGGDFNASQPPVQNPNGAAGVEVLFANPDNSRRIGDTISIAADAGAAAAALDNAKHGYADRFTGTWQPADVGFQRFNDLRHLAGQVSGGDGALVHRGQGAGKAGIRRRGKRSD